MRLVAVVVALIALTQTSSSVEAGTIAMYRAGLPHQILGVNGYGYSYATQAQMLLMKHCAAKIQLRASRAVQDLLGDPLLAGFSLSPTFGYELCTYVLQRQRVTRPGGGGGLVWLAGAKFYAGMAASNPWSGPQPHALCPTPLSLNPCPI